MAEIGSLDKKDGKDRRTVNMLGSSPDAICSVPSARWLFC